MSDPGFTATSSPRRHQLNVTSDYQQESTNNPSNQSPQSHRGSRAPLSPRHSQPPLLAPSTMPAEVARPSALAHGHHVHPWQSRHEERLPTVRSLINLPPLEPPQPLHPPALPAPPVPSLNPSNPSARHSWPMAATPLAPTIQSSFGATTLPANQPTYPTYASHHVAGGPSRPFPPAPHSLPAVSPISYTTSPRPRIRREDFAVSPEMRAPRRTSPPQTLHSHFIQRSPASESEQHRREMVHTGQVRKAIRTEYIPDRGNCYVYDDGSICEVSIGGEPVNPEWGLTKTGKPRKRLAKACNNCREKKVRCEPGESKCVRCARQGEECRWSDDKDPNAATSEPPADEARHADASSVRTLTPPYSFATRIVYDPVTDARDDNPRPLKRRRSNISPALSKTDAHEDSFKQPRRHESPTARRSRKEGERDTDFDPFLSDPAIASRLLTLFFTSSVCGSGTVLPQERLLGYARLADQVHAEDNTLIYTTLALGSISSENGHLKNLGLELASRATTSAGVADSSHANLSDTLARLHLALYYFAIDRRDRSQHHLSMGLADLKKLRLNVEEGAEMLTVSSQGILSRLGLSPEERLEAIRRAFWLGFLAERLCIVDTPHTSFTLLSEDTFLRLPSTNTSYHRIPHTTLGPLFDGGVVTFTPSRFEEVGPSSHLVLITSILGDVLTQERRFLHRRATATYQTDYTAFYTTTIRRLGEFETALPLHLRQHHENTLLHLQNGDLATYLAIHTIYHTAAMHLHRCCRHALLSQDQVRRNIQQATAHAFALFNIIEAVVQSAPSISDLANAAIQSPHQPHRHHHPPPPLPPYTTPAQTANALTLPLLPHATLLASDIISSTGTVDRHLTPTLHLLQSATMLMNEVGKSYELGKRVEELLVSRIERVKEVGRRGARSWKMDSALVIGESEGLREGEVVAAGSARGEGGGVGGAGGGQSGVGREFDIFYGVEEWVLLQCRGEFVGR